MMYGTVLRIKREAMGLTQAELGAKASVTGGSISQIETGKEVGDLVLNNVKYTIRKLEDQLNEEEYDNYKMRVAVGLACEEDDPDTKMHKLHNLMYSVIKTINNLERRNNGKNIIR